MRRQFHPMLLKYMRDNPRIWLITADLGYKMFDQIQTEFPDRFVNTGAAEQTMIGTAVGLADEGLIPVCYSITPFLLWTPAAWLRNYVNHERVSVKLVGGGRGTDYLHDGHTHDASDDKAFLSLLPNIRGFWPESLDDLDWSIQEWLFCQGPAYLNLKR